MTDLAGLNGVGRNSLATRNRRKVFLSTYCINSNESSIESPHGTPPMRRHSDVMRGSKIRQRLRSEEREDEKSICDRFGLVQREISPKALVKHRKGPLLRTPKTEMDINPTQQNLLMKTCSVFLKDKPGNDKAPKRSPKKKNRKNKCTYSIYSSPKKSAKGFHHKGLNKAKNKKNLKPPVIIIEDLDEVEERKKESCRNPSARDSLGTLLMKRRDSLKTIALKAKEKNCSKSKGKPDMSHIKAKWLLGLSLTMVSS